MEYAIRKVRPEELILLGQVDTSRRQAAKYTLAAPTNKLSLAIQRQPLLVPLSVPRWSLQELEGRLRLWDKNLQDGAIMLGAFADDKILGFALNTNVLADGTAELLSLWVDARVRRSGLGRALLERAEQEAARLPAKAMSLFTTFDNATAVDFYLARGYRIIGIQDNSLVQNKGWELRLAKELGAPK